MLSRYRILTVWIVQVTLIGEWTYFTSLYRVRHETRIHNFHFNLLLPLNPMQIYFNHKMENAQYAMESELEKYCKFNSSVWSCCHHKWFLTFTSLKICNCWRHSRGSKIQNAIQYAIFQEKNRRSDPWKGFWLRSWCFWTR